MAQAQDLVRNRLGNRYARLRSPKVCTPLFHTCGLGYNHIYVGADVAAVGGKTFAGAAGGQAEITARQANEADL